MFLKMLYYYILHVQHERDQRLDMDFQKKPSIPSLRNTRFTEFLIQKNALDEGGFKGWVFCPGMLFNSTPIFAPINSDIFE